MTELELYRRDIANSGASTAAVDALIESALELKSEQELKPVFEQLELMAGKLDWFRDSDYTALALQFAAPRAANAWLRQKLLSYALKRAVWCASCASAGGEGLARSLHVRELEGLLRDSG